MGFFTSNQQNNTPAARRKHLSNMRIIIIVAGGYILYEGISSIMSTPGTPAWFYIYLVLFTAAIVFALVLNEKRIKEIDRRIAEDEAKAAKEITHDDDEPNDLDEPR